MPMRFDPKFDSHERDPLADGGSARANRKAQKDEIKLRSEELLGVEGHGYVATTRDGDEDRTFMDLGWAEYVVRLGRGEYEPATGKGEFNAVDARVRASAVHGEIGTPEPDRVRRFVAAAPFVARLGDPTVHGTPLGPGLGSPNVLVGGMPAFRAVVDAHACLLPSPIPHGGGVVAVGAPTVLVNGFPVARAGDVIIEAGGGPNPIAYGSLNVWAGPLAPPVDVESTPSAGHGDGWIEFEGARARGDVLYAEAQAKAGVQAKDGAAGPSGKVKADAQGMLLRGEGQTGVRIRVPFIDQVLNLRVRTSLGLACYGAEGDLEIGADGKKTFEPKGLRAKRGVCGDIEGDWSFDDDPLED